MISDYYKQTVSIERYAETVNTVGTPIQAWTVASTISALFAPGSGNQRITDGKSAFVATHRVYCASGTDVTQKDRVSYGSSKYRILSIKNPNTLGHHTEILCEEIK